MVRTKLKLAVGAAAVLGAGLVGGVVLSGGGAVAAPGSGTSGEQRAPHEHIEVTGAALTEVTDAVTAYDDAIEVESVREDPDGSYDVLGTKAGEPVALDVSADLATITERTGGPGRGGPGGPCGPGEAPANDATTTPSALRVA